MNSSRHLHRDASSGAPDLFTGQALVGLEPSGRISLPATWRHRLETSAFILPRMEDQEPYVMMFSANSLRARLAEISSSSHRDTLLRSLSEVKVDRQGRIVIPDIVNMLGGASHAAILGSGDHLRVMSEQSGAYVTRYDGQVLEEII